VSNTRDAPLKLTISRPQRLDTAQFDTYTLLFVLAVENAPGADRKLVRRLRINFCTEISMPNHKSAEKRMRQNEKRREVNRSNRSRLRTSIKKLRAAMTAGDASQLSTALPETISTIDKAVQKGVLHRNAAARYKSRLTNRVNQLSAK
jgi:small subunit ribosomal protein S20